MNREVVSREEWIQRRMELLEKEKAATRALDELTQQRQALPWVKISEDYIFDTSTGQKTLGDLFNGKSQLIVYHFMFGPDWDAGCKSCSYLMDHFDKCNLHLPARDTTLVAVARTNIGKLTAFKQRLHWDHVEVVSSLNSSFNMDFGVSFPDPDAGEVLYNYRKTSPQTTDYPGMSVFYRDEDGSIYHTYSTFARGLDR